MCVSLWHPLDIYMLQTKGDAREKSKKEPLKMDRKIETLTIALLGCLLLLLLSRQTKHSRQLSKKKGENWSHSTMRASSIRNESNSPQMHLAYIQVYIFSRSVLIGTSWKKYHGKVTLLRDTHSSAAAAEWWKGNEFFHFVSSLFF